VLFGLNWLERQADEEFHSYAEAKRMYPGLQGEELEKKKRDMDVRRATEDPLFGRDAPALRARADELRDQVMGRTNRSNGPSAFHIFAESSAG